MNPNNIDTAITREDLLDLTSQIKHLADCVKANTAARLMPLRDGKMNASMEDARYLLNRINDPVSTYNSPH